jgi:hypothetical protein
MWHENQHRWAPWLSVSGMLSSFRSRITVHVLALVGPDRILFASDIPWVPEFAVAGAVEGLATDAKLDEAGSRDGRATECAAVCSLDLPQRTPAERTPLIEFNRPNYDLWTRFRVVFPRIGTTALAATRRKDRRACTARRSRPANRVDAERILGFLRCVR